MYIQEISIKLQENTKKEKISEIIEEFDLLTGFYRGSGQTQGKIASQYITLNNDKIVYLPFTLEKKSLDKTYNNYYVNKQIDKIEKICQASFQFKTLGTDNYQPCCTCEKTDFYILITNFITILSPLRCGNCHKSVPLYKIPIYYDYGYMPILSWETNYNVCDTLQMNCEVGEKWALKQMQEVNSQLSKQGLAICKKIAELTQIPTYYYLHNYRKIKYKKNQQSQLSQSCPMCKSEWDLFEKIHNFYDFKCDTCMLISTISPNLC